MMRPRSFLSLICCFTLVSGPAFSTELQPVGPGTYPVASTNIEVTLPEGAAMIDYLNGSIAGGKTRYLTDILAHREAALTLDVSVPAQSAVFGRFAGSRIPLALFVMYPTARDNARPDYAFPYKDTSDNVFPHMQKAGDAPILPDAAAKYPLIVYSGGYNTHGLWHLEHLKALASHGYIVVDVFHGDNRSSDFFANMALRPLEIRAALDLVLAHPQFGAVIDRERIGVSGASAGGYTVMALLGGIDPSGRMPAAADPRVKAGFGLVPFLGGRLGMWPFQTDAWLFGQKHEGLAQVKRPVLAVYGQKDTNVPPDGVEEGIRAVSGPAMAVMLDGETHSLSNAANINVNTWELTFFDAWLRGDAEAKRKLDAADSVSGGVHDHRTLQKTGN